VLINVGGLPAKPKAWQENSADLLIDRFRVMTVGPFLAIKHFLPCLEKSSNARVINIGSAMGSIGDNTFGTCMAYRLAKTALVQMAVTLSIDFAKEGRKVAVITIDPGFLPTRSTEYDFEDDMDTSIAGVSKIIEGATIKNSGQFLKWSAKQIPF